MNINPYAPPASEVLPPALQPLPPGNQRGMVHVHVNAALQLLGLCIHLLFCLSVAINVVQILNGTGNYATPPRDEAEALGQWVGVGGIGLWSLAGVVWTPLNAYGLWKLRPWGRTSTIVYWSISLITCCCTPMGIYGLISLLRGDVKALYKRA